MQTTQVATKQKSRFSRYAGLVAGASAMLIAGASQAAGIDIDVTDILLTLGLAIITVTAVCTAAISIVVVIKVFKYVRASF